MNNNKTSEILYNLFETLAPSSTELEFVGECSSCSKTMVVVIKKSKDEFEITGGALYGQDKLQHMQCDGMKCDSCYEKDKELRNYQPCEVYSRVVGYLRPISQWNPGKLSEFKDRTEFGIGGKA